MKTTIELPDELLTTAKATAAMRRTTLKAMIEHALRREIDYPEGGSKHSIYELNEHGFPVLKRDLVKEQKVSSEDVYQLMEDLGV